MILALPYVEALELIEMIGKDVEADQRFKAALAGIDMHASGSRRSSGTLRNQHSRMSDRIKRRGY